MRPVGLKAQVLRLGVGALLGLALPSCLLTGEAPDAGTMPPNNRCDADAQCPGAVCDRGRHVCVASPGVRTEVVFSALPPAGRSTATATATTLDARSVSSFEGSVDITLSAPRVVAGSVLYALPSLVGQPAGAPAPVAATVRFERHGSTSAEGAIEVEATAAPTVANGAYTFSRALVPGVYDVTVTPADLTRLPPYLRRDVELAMPDSTGAPQELSLAYPELSVVAGSVVDADTGLPVQGLAVRAVDPARDNALVSTVATTDAYGAYRLSLSPGARSLRWSVQLSSSPRATDARAPEWRLTYEASFAALGEPDATATTLAPLRVPRAMAFTRDDDGGCAACLELEATVEGQQADGASAGVGAASLSFRAEDVLGTLASGHRAWFDLRAVSQADGTVRARILAGTYRAVVTPPDSTRFAVTTVDLPVRGVGPYRGRVLALRRPVAVTGTVRDAARSTGMGNATVEAVPLRAVLDAIVANPSAAMRIARPSRTTTDSVGRYALLLDPGAYRLVARPSAGSGFAAQVASTTLIVPEAPAAEPLVPEAPASISNQDFELQAPLAVAGVVTGADGALLEGALVRAFARVRFEGGRAIDFELTSASADARGRYSLLLPSQLR